MQRVLSYFRLPASLGRKTALIITALTALSGAQATTILNVSYDPTRELYKEYNQLFEQHWRQTGGDNITVRTSHGGSGKQARSVIDGLQADVVTLALAGDIDAINSRQPLIAPDWQDKFADNSTPYTSTIVFLVRKGNPKQIHDWDDLVREGIEVITPNPKTSGGARWNFLAAWAFAKQKYGSDDKALAFVSEIYRHVPVLDTGARGATTSFVQRGLGDVLLAWENEAYLALAEQGGDAFEIVTPSLSILAEPPVAVVDAVVDKKGTRQQAQAYLQYLYSDEAQHVIAKHFYRPRNPAILAQYSDRFPPLTLVNINQAFGGWAQVQKTYFDDGGVFDQIFAQINE
ncbi:sulfate ABC transporter substrate-binding protein [Necropsobacter massiliensis]|uniref:sulfate ABC transporter substrate-binding protein n=1 Tax=Necropsobacter massiliensis TaxID=1400001 RepID=UPI0009E40A71|nr:sulfate ABC transporter substrate-binding protein [Necropsobacter massiliensis]